MMQSETHERDAMQRGDAVLVNFEGWSSPNNFYLAVARDRSAVPARVLAVGRDARVLVRVFEEAEQRFDEWVPINRVTGT